MKNYPLVLIEWEDSRQPCGSWKWQSALNSDVVKCSSVGWLMVSDKNKKILAQNVGDCDDDDIQCSGTITIPTRCIIKIVKLDK